jgi:hypothetical protein
MAEDGVLYISGPYHQARPPEFAEPYLHVVCYAHSDQVQVYVMPCPDLSGRTGNLGMLEERQGAPVIRVYDKIPRFFRPAFYNDRALSLNF